MTVYGTRPEAIKLAPLIKAIERTPDLDSSVVITAQHREMLDQVNSLFEIKPSHDLDVFEHGQSLNALVAKVFHRLDPLLEEIAPDAIVVQGDTSTVAAAAMAAFYRSIPVVHLEAGLRSHDITSPFPEEANRKIATQISRLHLAPTESAKQNLLNEKVPPSNIVVTGNTVIDALLHVVDQPHTVTHPEISHIINSERPIILISTHRRENWEAPMRRIADALSAIAEEFPSHTLIVPMHRNPRVRNVLEPVLTKVPNVVLTEPLDYLDFVHVLNSSKIVITDSGGVQEEAPSLGKPVLVLRDNTERPEAVEAGTVRLVGTHADKIIDSARDLLTHESRYMEMARAINPYGDGHAAQRSVEAIRQIL